MKGINKQMAALAVSLGVFVGLALAAGCGEKKETSDASAAPVSAADDATGGKAVYATANCANCHAIGGQGGQKGPELTHAGAEAGHDAAWFAAFVKDPKSKNPGSHMPAFGGRVSDADLAKLGAYLATLK